jgi:hypothetical protein
MSKSDEYRANAAECQRMAGKTSNPQEKRTWLEMADHWLRMIAQPKQTPSERFDAAEQKDGTGQTKSKESH